MDEERLNCWEFKKCGREPNGRNVSVSGVCAVATEVSVDGIHDGKNGGRCCWAVISVSHDNLGGGSCRILECLKCEFYKMVKDSTELIVEM